MLPVRLLLAAIPAPPSNAMELGPLTIRYYGLAIAIGALVGITLVRRRYAKFGGDPELADRVALWAIAFGFLGARLAYTSTNLDRFFPDRPYAILFVWEGGLALFGGLTFGTIALLYLVRRGGGDVPAFFDAVAPALPIAQAFGRLGNYFNQELYGTPTDLPWALEVDPERRVAPYTDAATFHPTFAYEALWNLALAAVIIWLGRSGRLRKGSLGFVYAIGYGLIRFLLELIRTDTTFRLFGLSRNAYVALVVLAIGAAGLWWYQRRPEPEPERESESEPRPATAGGDGEAISDDAPDRAERSDPDRP